MSAVTSRKHPVKQSRVKEIQDLVNKHKVIGIVDMENLPALQFMRMTRQLRGKAKIFMVKKRLIRIAFKNVKKEKFDHFVDSMKGMPALIVSNEDPFKLYKEINKSKSSAAAKPGQIAPKDLVAPAGPTPFAPGPIIGELGQLGIKTGVEGGKVAIKEDKVLAKEGSVISDKAASLLAKLGVEPMEIGLNVLAIYDNGMIYTKDVLGIDEEQVLAELKQVAWESLAVALEIGYITKDTIQPLIIKAVREASALERKIPQSTDGGES